MCSLLSKQGAHRGAINTATVGQSMYSLSSNRCAHCAAIVMLSNTAFMQQCGNQYSRYEINSASYSATIRNQLRTFSDRIFRSAVKATSVPSVTKMRHRRLHERLRVIPSCVASDLRGMERRIMVQVCVYTNGRFGNNTQKKVSYYEWQVHVS